MRVGRQAIHDGIILQVLLRHDLALFDGLLGHQPLEFNHQPGNLRQNISNLRGRGGHHIKVIRGPIRDPLLPFRPLLSFLLFRQFLWFRLLPWLGLLLLLRPLLLLPLWELLLLLALRWVLLLSRSGGRDGESQKQSKESSDKDRSGNRPTPGARLVERLAPLRKMRFWIRNITCSLQGPGKLSSSRTSK